MKRRILLTVAAGAVLAASAAAPALSKETVTYGYLLDPAMEGVLHAIKSGMIKSDKIDIDAKALPIPALIASTPTKRFDVLMNAVMAIPLAKARGLDLVVLSTALRSAPGGRGAGVWVRKDSPYKTLADIKGKTIGNYALQSTGTTWVRIALWRKHGFNVSYKGGDFNWVQIQAPQILTALESKRIDAGTLIHTQIYQADKSGNYRALAETNADLKELYGIYSVAAVNVTYPEKLQAKPEVFKEFNRMMRESAVWALENPDKAGEAVHKATGGKVPADFFKYWITELTLSPGAVSENDVKSMNVVWQQAKEMGILKAHPKAEDVVWDQAIRE
jgi:NitT/TauT family transport system substrate-binding protein